MSSLRRSSGVDPGPGPVVGDLFRQHRLAMTRLAFVLLGDAAVADEVVQEAFLQLYARWERVDNPVGYVRTTVVNGCRSLLRHRAVQQRTVLAVADAVMAEPTNHDLDLDVALAKLPYRQRAALALRYFSDLSDADIAVTLGVRPATVRSLIHRGLSTLRKEISR